MEIEIFTDPIKVIRRARDLYFPVPSRMGEMMMSKLAYQALILGAPETSIARHAEWWIFSASIDWIAARPQSAAKVFTTIELCPEDGPNSHRYEIVVAAFAGAYLSIGQDGEMVFSGDTENVKREAEKYRLRVPNGRVLAFRL